MVDVRKKHPRLKLCVPCLLRVGHRFVLGPKSDGQISNEEKLRVELISALFLESSTDVDLAARGLLFALGLAATFSIETVYIHTHLLHDGVNQFSLLGRDVTVVNIRDVSFDDEKIIWVGDFSRIVSTHGFLVQTASCEISKAVSDWVPSYEAYQIIAGQAEGTWVRASVA